MNLKEISDLLQNKLNIKVDNIEIIKERGLNYVYKVYSNDNIYILKIYRKKIDFNNSNNLINYLNKNNIKTISTAFEFEKDDYIYKLYPYIKGKHIYKYNSSNIDNITDLLSLLYRNNLNNNSYTILDKCDNYISYLSSKKDKIIDNNIYNLLFESYKRLSFDKNEFALVHGDLSNTNLIWNDSLNIIDFDEAIEAPREYEICSCIIKNCFNNGIFNLDQAKKIFNSINNKIDINYDKFRKSWNLYIIKVIIEKLYYLELSNNKNNKKGKDHWSYWFKLFLDEKVISELFDYNKKAINAKSTELLKDDYKSRVEIITDSTNKKHIEKTEYSIEATMSKNEFNLVNMLNNFELNDLEIYNLSFDKNNTKKQLSYCDGYTKKNPDNNDLINITKKLYKIHEFLLKYGNNLNNIDGNIFEKLKWCLEILDDTDYAIIIKELLNDKSFAKALENENKVIILDDLHRDNIIYNKDITFIDLYGLKKYPESLQLASLIVNQLLAYDDYRTDIIINNWPKKTDEEYLNKLIQYRIIKGLAFYEKYLVQYDNEEYNNTAKNLRKSLSKISDWR